MLQLRWSDVLNIPAESIMDLERGEDALSDCKHLNIACQLMLARGIQAEYNSQWIAKLNKSPSLDFYVR